MKSPKGKAGPQRAQRINEEITAKEVRLIDADGEQAGVMSGQEALAAAEEVELDLVEISPDAKPPVCRIMDYGKFLFEKKKAAAAAKKKQVQVQIKEIKFRPGTDIGDYNVKLRNLIKFLEHGDKAKITVRFRGREMAHKELGMELLSRVEKDLEEYGEVESRPTMMGRQMTMVMAPTKKKK
ncbi:translation initiation factor IF-3 [Pleionea sediminis]|uniref:translation initiation factor IF-3 n=1 Tax=Pleionea sediminis TaxID=2569479 RepID=UPI00118484D5|nr:translation initiation factor IF-3 [Pleionea sediminis]